MKSEREHITEVDIGSVTDSNPNDLWRWSEPIEKRHEVTVLRHYDCPSLPSSKKDLLIVCVTKTEITDRGGFHALSGGQP